ASTAPSPPAASTPDIPRPPFESTSGTLWHTCARRGGFRGDHRRAKRTICLMPGGRLELPRPCGQRILSLLDNGTGDPAGLTARNHAGAGAPAAAFGTPVPAGTRTESGQYRRAVG